MEKVICKFCKKIQYTSSPMSALCSCGGKLRIIYIKADKNEEAKTINKTKEANESIACVE